MGSDHNVIRVGVEFGVVIVEMDEKSPKQVFGSTFIEV